MCEQTEINYLEGDVVWVKLGAYWWPSQVSSFDNLPEDIQKEFSKKPIIAVVKFFQEDTYEFVKNYQQIYKYNCTHKDEFIKKGLDKYRSRNKEGSSYMDKFPGDVEIAERLTGGDEDILSSEKYNPEEKPDLSGLFGEKKLPKKKRDRDFSFRRSDGSEIMRQITHPRFLHESDHEIRIRPQKDSVPSSPNNSSTGGLYPCYMCNFTTTRVNVIICHMKSHLSGGISPMTQSKLKNHLPKSRMSDSGTPKRKVTRKPHSSKSKNDSATEPAKRKPAKQPEPVAKKKKIDPVSCEKLLEDWDDGSDEESLMMENLSTPMDTSSIIDPPVITSPPNEVKAIANASKDEPEDDGTKMLEETEKLLKETDNLSKLQLLEDLTGATNSSNKLSEAAMPKMEEAQSPKKGRPGFHFKKSAEPTKPALTDSEDKKARLSCFDFNEDDMSEPTITPVRKLPRVKNMSLKKELILEYEMSQALKNERRKECLNIDLKAIIHDPDAQDPPFEMKSKIEPPKEKIKSPKEDKSPKGNAAASKVTLDEKVKPVNLEKKFDEPEKLSKTEAKNKGASKSTSKNDVEIVEIFEVEREDEVDEPKNFHKSSKKDPGTIAPIENQKDKEKNEVIENRDNVSKTIDQQFDMRRKSLRHSPIKETRDTFSDRMDYDSEDESVSDTILAHSENSDTDCTLPDVISEIIGVKLPMRTYRPSSIETVDTEESSNSSPRKRGRPKKHSVSVEMPSSDNEQTKQIEKTSENFGSPDRFESEGKTSESDTDRSSSGRRRKPNRKYQSNLYMQCLEQKATKTDESQSESDDRPVDYYKTKSKRGRKSQNLRKKSIDSIGKDEELEFSDQADQPTKSKMVTEVDLKSNDDLPLMEVEKANIESEVIEKPVTIVDHKMDEEVLPKNDMSEKMNNVKALNLESKDTKVKEQLNTFPEESNGPKQTINMLPPKKSQIKKFELSQIDLLESNVEKSVPVESETKMEKIEVEIEPLKLESVISQDEKTVEDSVAEVHGESVEIITMESEETNSLNFTQVEEKIDLPQTPVECPTNELLETQLEDKSEKVEEILVTEPIEETILDNSAIVQEVSVPMQEVSVQPEPMEEVVSSEPLKEAPVSLEVVQEIPLPSEPVQDAPMQNEPVVSEPVQDLSLSAEQIPVSLPSVSIQNEILPSRDDCITSIPSHDSLKEPEVISPKKVVVDTRFKGKFTPETGYKFKKDRDAFLDDKRYESFQDAFVKTLQIDPNEKKSGGHVEEAKIKKHKKPAKKRGAEINDISVSQASFDKTNETLIENTEIPANEIQQVMTDPFNVENYEIVVADDVAMVDKPTVVTSHSQDKSELLVQLTQDTKPEVKVDKSASIGNVANTVAVDFKKLNESTIPISSPISETSVPVKKREKPRIIETVTLKEPMILKSKLLEKIPHTKIGKHKLESDNLRKIGPKGSPKAKVMKIDSTPTNSKSRSPNKGQPHMTLAKKLQALKAEEIVMATNQTITPLPMTEKYIQQSSESLVDMDLDINSMPFVMSEDLLTPENIDQIPVVISSIIPSSSLQPNTISLGSPGQVVATNPTFQPLQESIGEGSKKKSGTPTILKSKPKAKPTITSIKTIVPPLTGGVKGLKLQNTQGTRTSPLITQKGQSGKYVIVQTTGNPPMRYSVQAKGTPQKIAIPASSKGSQSAQIVQQSGKVVILTSPQSGSPKMLPLNISKTLSGKAVQRIMTSKGQVFAPVSNQSVITSKSIIAPGSPTTSKIAPGQKIINAQGIISSKGVLTQLPGTLSKSNLLSLPQGILTKSGIYTPISAAALGGKTILGSKTLVSAKGSTILSPQNLSASKIIGSVTPSGKIMSAQGIVTSKGTVLTPITGQQVKALAAKSPAKGKLQYQQIQRKVQLPVTPKGQKLMPTSPQIRSTSKATGTVVLQNASTEFTAITPNKKGSKHLVNQVALSTVLASPNSTQIPASSPLQKKVILSSPGSKIMSRGSNRATKAQQKIIVQKISESGSPVQNLQIKSSSLSSPSPAKMIQPKHLLSNTVPTKLTSRSTKTQPKNLLNAAINSITASSSASLLPQTLPPLEPIQEKKAKVDESPPQIVIKDDSPMTSQVQTVTDKVEETKPPSAPQIMALPTESSDGTQTYVLVTIDEQGQIQPLDNNTLMSLDGSTQNPDGSRTLYIDPSSLGESGGLENIVLQFDNGSVTNLSSAAATTSQTVTDNLSTEIVHTPNQDILAAALANTDFQQEIGLPEPSTASIVSAGLTQTSLINQTILQSTIIPPTEPISSPAVLETSLTLNQPIMTPLEVPSSLPIQSDAAPVTGIATIPTSLELPITITNPNISYITAEGNQIQIPGNSMPEIGEIMETQVVPTTAQYLVIPNLEEGITVRANECQKDGELSYSVSISENMVIEANPIQTTPSMPIIDDSYVEENQFNKSLKNSSDDSFNDISVTEMLVPKAPAESSKMEVLEEEIVTTEVAKSSSDLSLEMSEPVSSQDTPEGIKENELEVCEESAVLIEEEVMSSQEVTSKEPNNGLDLVIESVTSQNAEANMEAPSSAGIACDTLDTTVDQSRMSHEAEALDKHSEGIVSRGSPIVEQVETSNQEDIAKLDSEVRSSNMAPNEPVSDSMEIEPVVESQIFDVKEGTSNRYSKVEPSSQAESKEVAHDSGITFDEAMTETSQEVPSQSYEQFNVAGTSDAAEVTSQSAKSENSREPSQSVIYEPMEVDDIVDNAGEPPTQSYEDSKRSEASRSYVTHTENNTNAPTQSFNEIMQCQDDRASTNEITDDPSFPTQSYEVEKMEGLAENLEMDPELSQEGNIPSQSNDIGNDGIGTSSIFTNNSGMNEDETASSSYVPETPETQERDQDQESAISTSSYEIPPCDELNIASSSEIPDTSVRSEHSSIHNNGVPEIPTSSYNLNPDSSSTHVDAEPTSSYEDRVIVEQNVSTSYNVPMSMPGLEETSDDRNEPTSYYPHHPEVTASYYESMRQESNSRLEVDPQGEVTPSYYEANPCDISSEASQSYFAEEATPSYSSHRVDYYEPRPEGEASQSYYSSQDLRRPVRSSLQNVEATQSFYQDNIDGQRIRQRGEATPTYTERYPVDYVSANSPLDRHDLVESSVPATKPTER